MPTFEVETGFGSATATSYASVATADDYHSMGPTEATWAALSTEQKQERLMLASALLDERCDWRGDKAVTASALRWPRLGLLDRDGIDVASTTIPARLAWATAELARLLGASAPVLAGEARSVSSKSTGPVSITYEGAGSARSDLPRSVIEWVSGWIFPPAARVMRA